MIDSRQTRHGSRGALPERYGYPVMRVIPCNPNRLFVYWELPEDVSESDTRLLLLLFDRIAEGTGTSEYVSEFEIPTGSSSLYIDLPFPLKEYMIELVRITDDGSRQRILSTKQTAHDIFQAGDRAVKELPIDASYQCCIPGKVFDNSKKTKKEESKSTKRVPPGKTQRIINFSSGAIPGSAGQ